MFFSVHSIYLFIYSFFLWLPQVDEVDGFHTNSILCMAIKNALGQVVGVAQLTNKLDGTPFNQNDENLFEVSLTAVHSQ